MIDRTFEIPLQRPLQLASGTLVSRSGRFVSDQDHYAEISPLWMSPLDQQRSLEWAAHQMSQLPADVTVTCNGLIDRLPLPETDQEATALEKMGYTVVKLKVGNAISAEKDRIACAQIYIPRLRVDANRSLTLREAEELFDGQEIDYAEEPLSSASTPAAHLDNLEELSMRTGIWYALDETLRELTPTEMPRLDGLKALVIKPQVLGNMTFAWLDWAKANGKEVVISSVFESAVGLHHLALLAQSFPGPHGLDAQHLTDPPIEQQGPTWIFKAPRIRQWMIENSHQV